MKICVLCSGFPSRKSAGSVFVIRLCEEMTRQGHAVTIISPQRILRIVTGKDLLSPKSFIHETATGEQINVLRPFLLSFGKLPIVSRANSMLRRWTIKRAVKKAEEQDAYYAHFWDNGFFLYQAIKHLGKPLLVATGESIIKFRTSDAGFKRYVNGVVCVSTKNMEESIAVGLTTKDKCIVIPNAIDSATFRKMDKRQCRRELGIDERLFVVIYVGQFLQRKGYDRVAAAIDQLNDDTIGAVFLGGEKEGRRPRCQGIIKCGLVVQSEIPKYLNAADLFVLPTRAEGCCNAIVEAMACGLPIVSSDLSFNHDILDSTNALLINPESIEDIAGAIKKVKDSAALQSAMSKSSLEKAKGMFLMARAEKIISFINERSKR